MKQWSRSDKLTLALVMLTVVLIIAAWYNRHEIKRIAIAAFYYRYSVPVWAIGLFVIVAFIAVKCYSFIKAILDTPLPEPERDDLIEPITLKAHRVIFYIHNREWIEPRDPYCLKCFESSRDMVKMTDRLNLGDYNHWICHRCGNTFEWSTLNNGPLYEIIISEHQAQVAKRELETTKPAGN